MSNVADKVNNLEPRERALITLVLLAVVFLVWDFTLNSWSSSRLAQQQQSLNSEVKQLDALQQERLQLLTEIAEDPNVQKREYIANMQRQITELDAQLSELSQGLVDADVLPSVLQDVLAKAPGLSLVSLKTYPVSELGLSVVSQVTASSNNTIEGGGNDDTGTNVAGESASTTTAVAQPDNLVTAGVYRHQVDVTVTGRYFDVLAYLNTLESMPWRFYWQHLTYSVTDFPAASVTIQVYTLSADRGLMGVEG